MHFSLYLTAILVHVFLPEPAEKQVPVRNQQLIDYARKSGRKISPTYETAVCTEFLIAVLQNATTLSARDKKRIRIQTKEPLAKLIRTEDNLIRGVQWALVSSGKGVAIPLEEVLPGDLVQYWDSWAGIIPFGHCGIVTGISPGKSIRLISSSPHTDGYGEMDFPWPEKMFFVRLKDGHKKRPEGL